MTPLISSTEWNWLSLFANAFDLTGAYGELFEIRFKNILISATQKLKKF